MDFETILLKQDGDYARIYLNRPEVLNSLNKQLLGELKTALQRVMEDATVRAVMITGMGRAFCAGQDLGEELSESQSIEQLVKEQYNPIVALIREMPKPVLATVNGIAAGAGVSIALMCDLVIAAETAQFMLAFSRVGLIPDCGGTFILPRLIGMGRASASLLLGETLSAQQALEWGMIYQVISEDELEAAGMELLQKLAKQPTRALAYTKYLLNQTFAHTFSQQLDLEAIYQEKAVATDDFKEGKRAFIEKRPAKFTGQ